MRMLLFMAICSASIRVLSSPCVTSVEAHQRYPWNGHVDIVVTLEGSADDMPITRCTFVATNSATGASVPVKSVTQKGADTGSGTSWIRRYIWNATNDVGLVKVDDLALTVDAEPIAVQLWEDGPYWATCNVGASKPEEYGYYFWWGDTVGYKRNASNNGWISVKDGSEYCFADENCPTHGKSMSELLSEGYVDSTGNLTAAHDAATAHLGAPWRMPTDAEFSALISNCDTTWTTRGGVYGRLVTGRGGYVSKSIFLPGAGYGWQSYLNSAGSVGYSWTSTWSFSDVGHDAYYRSFDSSCFNCYVGARRIGSSVRPLRVFSK